jgi:hypothetical protein
MSPIRLACVPSVVRVHTMGSAFYPILHSVLILRDVIGHCWSPGLSQHFAVYKMAALAFRAKVVDLWMESVTCIVPPVYSREADESVCFEM